MKQQGGREGRKGTKKAAEEGREPSGDTGVSCPAWRLPVGGKREYAAVIATTVAYVLCAVLSTELIELMESTNKTTRLQ